MSMYKNVHYYTVQRELALNFFKVQKPVQHIDSMAEHRLSTA